MRPRAAEEEGRLRLTRRSVLLGGVSSAVLLGLPPGARRPAPAIPADLYAPGTEAMAHAVRSIADLLKPSLIGVDIADLRAVLQDAGPGAFGQGTVWTSAPPAASGPGTRSANGQ